MKEKLLPCKCGRKPRVFQPVPCNALHVFGCKKCKLAVHFENFSYAERWNEGIKYYQQQNKS